MKNLKPAPVLLSFSNERFFIQSVQQVRLQNKHKPSEDKPLYDAYKKKVKALILSDEERFEFERIVFKMIERNRNERI